MRRAKGTFPVAPSSRTQRNHSDLSAYMSEEIPFHAASKLYRTRLNESGLTLLTRFPGSQPIRLIFRHHEPSLVTKRFVKATSRASNPPCFLVAIPVLML